MIIAAFTFIGCQPRGLILLLVFLFSLPIARAEGVQPVRTGSARCSVADFATSETIHRDISGEALGTDQLPARGRSVASIMPKEPQHFSGDVMYAGLGDSGRLSLAGAVGSRAGVAGFFVPTHTRAATRAPSSDARADACNSAGMVVTPADNQEARRV